MLTFSAVGVLQDGESQAQKCGCPIVFVDCRYLKHINKSTKMPRNADKSRAVLGSLPAESQLAICQIFGEVEHEAVWVLC